MRRLAYTGVSLTALGLLSLWLASLPGWVWHPLMGRGYQLWSGVASDVSEVTLPVGLITAVVAVRRTLHQHLECHEETCRRIGVHRVPNTNFRTCWQHNPALGEHPRHGIPLHVIHEAFHEAKR